MPTDEKSDASSNADAQFVKRGWWTLAVILTIGAAARIYGLNARTMFDEAASWTFVTLPWPAFLKVLWTYDGNMTLYYLLLRGWVQFGESEIYLRSLSVVFGIAALICTYALGTRLFNHRTGLIATLFLALQAFHVRFSQEARSYALAVLLLVWSTLLFVDAIRSRSRSSTIAYVVVSALACYAQLLAVFVLAAQWLWFLLTHGFKGLRERLGTMIALAAAIAPMGIYAVWRDSGQVDWIKPLNRYRFVEVLTAIGGGTLALLLVYVAMCAVALLLAIRYRTEKVRSSHTVLLLFWAIVPMALLGIVSVVKPMFIERYLLMCVPAVMLLAASAVDRALDGGKAMKTLGALVFVAIIGLSAQATLRQYETAAAEPDFLRQMTHHVLEHGRNGDAIIFYTASTYMSFQYYSHRLYRSADAFMPQTIIPNFGGVPTGAQTVPTVDEIRNATRNYDRVWVVLNQSGIRLVPGAKDGLPVLQQTLSESYSNIARTDFGFLNVHLLERHSTASTAGLSGH